MWNIYVHFAYVVDNLLHSIVSRAWPVSFGNLRCT